MTPVEKLDCGDPLTDEELEDLILGNICKIPNYQFRSLSE